MQQHSPLCCCASATSISITCKDWPILYHKQDIFISNLPSTQDVLVKTPLTPLTLGPQPWKLLLQDVEVRDLFLIDLRLLWFTVLTHSYTYNHNQSTLYKVTLTVFTTTNKQFTSWWGKPWKFMSNSWTTLLFPIMNLNM